MGGAFARTLLLVLTAPVLLGSAGCDRDSEGVAGSSRPATESNGSQNPEQLPVLAEVPEFELLSEDGEPVSSEDLKGTPYVAAFMFTRCPTICPKVTAKMKSVADAAKRAGKAASFVSFSVDGEHDTPEVLHAYAKKHGVDRKNFHFLTGENEEIAEHAELGFKVGVSGEVDPEKPHLGITHGSHLVLVDQKGRIRGYYRSSDQDVAVELVDDLDRL